MSTYEERMRKLAVEKFTTRYEGLTAAGKVVEFNPEFKNSTGYLDHAVTMVKLSPGEEATMLDDFKRPCVLVGTLFGTVVIFRRYTDREDVWGCNYPQKLKAYGMYSGSTGIKDEAKRYLDELLGEFNNDNIGQRLQKLLNEKAVVQYFTGKNEVHTGLE